MCGGVRIFAYFSPAFRDFLNEFVEDVKTFLVASQQPQAGPKAPAGTAKKSEQLCENQFLDFFWPPVTPPVKTNRWEGQQMLTKYIICWPTDT